MAKLPPMLFTLAVEQEQLFAALLACGAKLTIGVPEPVERKPSTKRMLQNGAATPLMLPAPGEDKGRKRKENSATQLMLRQMAKEPKAVHAMSDLARACEDGGSSKGAASVAMSNLLKAGQVERVGVGQYKLTHAPGIEPKRAVPKTKEPKRAVKQNGKTNREVIWSMFASGEPVTLAEIIAHFEKDDRQPKSISPQIANLKNGGLIEQVDKGIYKITEKGKANGTTG